MNTLQACLTAAIAALCLAAEGAPAQTLIDEWGTAKIPPPPELKPAKIDARETALLVMDFTTQTCTRRSAARGARLGAQGPKLVTDARAKGALVIYSVAVPGSVAPTF